MTPEPHAQVRERLLQMLEDLEAAERRERSGTRTVELDQLAVGRLSRMDALQNQAMAQANSRQRDVQSQRIRAALSRLADGSYGDCLDCGEPIAVKRLEQDPTAVLCIDCASG